MVYIRDDTLYMTSAVNLTLVAKSHSALRFPSLRAWRGVMAREARIQAAA